MMQEGHETLSVEQRFLLSFTSSLTLKLIFYNLCKECNPFLSNFPCYLFTLYNIAIILNIGH